MSQGFRCVEVTAACRVSTVAVPEDVPSPVDIENVRWLNDLAVRDTSPTSGDEPVFSNVSDMQTDNAAPFVFSDADSNVGAGPPASS